MDFHDFGVWMPNGLKRRPAALIETFARYQAGFLSTEDFHRFLLIFVDVRGYPLIFIDFLQIFKDFKDFGMDAYRIKG